MSLNLGDVMKEAGVKGARKTMCKEDLLNLSIKGNKESYPHEAMGNLGKKFVLLKSAKRGKDFLKELEIILSSLEDGEITQHTVAGICQLAHWLRDESDLGPANKKSFGRIIPGLVDLKNRIIKNSPKNIGAYLKEMISKWTERGVK